MNRMMFGAKPSVLRCARCGRFVDWEDSRLQVVCGCRPHLELPPVLVREASDADRQKALELFRRDFGAGQLVAYGKPVALEDAPALVAETEDTDMAGALTWRHFEGAFHILALATDPMWQRAGVGGYLVAEAELLARRQQQPRVVVTITNDNLPALYFYQRRGYRLAALRPDAVAPHTGRAVIGFAGIPIQDELQLVKTF